MKCEEIRELLPEYFAGGLSHEHDDRVEDHIHHCASCNELVTLWNELGKLPVEQPSPMLRERYEAMLAAYQAGQLEKSRGKFSPHTSGNPFSAWLAGNWLRPALAMAAALVLMIGGFAAGRITHSETSNAEQQLAAMKTELAATRQLVVLSMLQQQSATERLQGVTWSTQQAQSDPKILEALLHTLRYDSSVDVRLAALDALRRHSEQPIVRKGFADALQPQQSPLVQVLLIDAMVESKQPGAAQQLRKIQNDLEFNPVVRKRAEWALQNLH
jgi:hypothetical protein